MGSEGEQCSTLQNVTPCKNYIHGSPIVNSVNENKHQPDLHRQIDFMHTVME